MEVDRNSLFNCCPNPHILNGLGLNKMPLSFCKKNRNKKKNNLQPIYYNVSVDLCVLKTVWDLIQLGMVGDTDLSCLLLTN